jgi:hypothetical protein
VIRDVLIATDERNVGHSKQFWSVQLGAGDAIKRELLKAGTRGGNGNGKAFTPESGQVSKSR